MRAPALKDFIFHGRWDIETRVLDVWFVRVAPRVKNISMSQCLRHGFADWIVSTLRNLPRLATAVLKMIVSKRNILSAGLGAVVDEGGSIKYHKFIEPPAERTVAIHYRFW